MLPSSLQISIVTYRPEMKLLERCLRKLALAIAAGRQAGVVRTVHLALIDNSEDRDVAEAVIRLGKAHFDNAGVHVTYLHGHANIGYGAAHNLVLHGTGSDYHLVLNPDVELAPDALAKGVAWLDAHEDVGALAPLARNAAKEREYLCKRYPAILDLILRGFAPAFVRRIFRRRLMRYELRDVIDDETPNELIGIPALSGAFMLVKRFAIDQTGGFDPRFFLYFEDFDWSVRLNRVTHTAFVPSVEIGHHGGRAARKGFRHIRWFVRSGIRFYRRHGWKWF
ncbi:MAG: glycosyltransferase family 2 protein [Burkholderiales bacterium]|nr:glycosyltransferase family 2 protein [Burkholderiales bacterium]